jgi:septum formation protein
MRLILGSGSPRRLDLLAQLGVVPGDVRPPDVDETPRKGELPRAYCLRVTCDKAAATQVDPGDIAICADTTVAVGRRIMGKPSDRGEARAFLRQLSGRRHRVITAVAVTRDAQLWSRVVTTTLRVQRLSDADLEAYLETGDWQGKAGGYSIQGPFAAFVPWLQGSYTSVVGLPLHETAGLLRAAGFPVLGRPV